MPILATALLTLCLASPAHAGLIPCEQRGSMELDPDGSHVLASFLGACGEVSDYDRALAVQVELDDGWSIIGTHWEVQGSQDIEIDGELVTYRIFEQEVSCPGRGPYDFRVAWVDRDGAEAWYDDRFDCDGSLGCTSAPTPMALPPGMLALVGILPLTLRRRRR